MANVDRPHGFVPISTLSGAPIVTHQYKLAAANKRIRKYDVLILTSAGLVDGAEASADPYVAGTQTIGVAAEDKAASDGGNILVYDQPDLVMEAQTDGAGVDAQTDLNLNYDIISTATSTENHSIMEVDASSGSTTAATPLKVLRLYPLLNNDFGANARVECTFNMHALGKTGVAGV